MALASTVVGADGYILESSGGWIVPWLAAWTGTAPALPNSRGQ